MECFKNIIGFNGLCEDDNTYTYLLDDIGIGLLDASKIADSKFLNGKDLLERKINQAWRDIISSFEFKGFMYKEILCTASVDAGLSDKILQNGVGTINIKKERYRNTSTIIPTISVSGDVIKITISDGQTTEEFENINNTNIYPKGNYYKSNITVTIEYNTLENVSRINSGNCCAGHNLCNYKFTSDNNTSYGLSIIVHEMCDIEAYLCRYADMIGEAVLYRAGALILKELMDNNRINDFKIMKSENLMLNMAYMDSSLNLFNIEEGKKSNEDGMVQVILNRLKHKIPAPDDKFCVECNKSIYIHSLP